MNEELTNLSNEKTNTHLEILKEGLKNIEPYFEQKTENVKNEKSQEFAEPSQIFEPVEEQHYVK